MKKKIGVFILLFIVFMSLLFVRIQLNKIDNHSNDILFRQDISSYDDNTWAQFTSEHAAIGNETKIEVHITNQSDLESYLLRTGNDLSGDMIWFDNNEDISFPTGTYTFTERTEFYIPSASGNIDFHGSFFVLGGKGVIYTTVLGDQHNRTYKNLTIYGNVSNEIGDTGNGTYNSSTNLTRLGLGFYMQAIKASNFVFENLEFNSAHMAGSHLFDIMGCNNFKFINITNRGTMEDWTSDQLNQIYSVSAHAVYAEMIQIDVTGSSSIGLKTFLSSDFQNNYYRDDLVGDEVPTTNTSLTNVRSTSYRGPLGQSIIDKTNTVVNKPYCSTIGAHGVGNSAYTGIEFNNVSFENVVHINGKLDKAMAPVHFVVVSSNTRRTISESGATGDEMASLIRNDSVWNATDISINNNKYINCSNEFYDLNTPGQKTETSTYLADFAKDKLDVTKVNLIDEEGNIIKSYDNYVPEEVIYNNYIYDSSDYSNGVLNRYYRSPHNEIIELKNNYDEQGQLLSNLDGYKFKEKKVTSQTVEQLLNGDKITVQHTDNTYEKATMVLIDVPNTAAFSTIINVLLGLVLIGLGSMAFVINRSSSNN